MISYGNWSQVVDFPHSTRAKKYFLVLMVGGAGPMLAAKGAQGGEEGDFDNEEGTVAIAGRHQQRCKKRRAGAAGSGVRSSVPDCLLVACWIDTGLDASHGLTGCLPSLPCCQQGDGGLYRAALLKTRPYREPTLPAGQDMTSEGADTARWTSARAWELQCTVSVLLQYSARHPEAKGKAWILKKKEQARQRGYTGIPVDTKYTGRKRKDRF